MAPPRIHPTANVDQSARLGPGVLIAANVTIERGVSIGADSEISAGCVLHSGCSVGARNRLQECCIIGSRGFPEGTVAMGDGNVVGAHCTIGAFPDDSESFIEPMGPIIIGDDNRFGPNVILQYPAHPHSATRVGSRCSLMSGTMVCHDAMLGDGAVLYPSSGLAGDAVLCSGGRVGAMSFVHQRCTIGAGAMIGMVSAVPKDVPPFVMVISGSCTRLNRFLLSRVKPPPSDADIAAYVAWLTGPYASAAMSNGGEGGKGPDARADVLPTWVSASLASGGEAAPPWFAEFVSDFFRSRMGARKLAPLARDYEGGTVGAVAAPSAAAARSRL